MKRECICFREKFDLVESGPDLQNVLFPAFLENIGIPETRRDEDRQLIHKCRPAVLAQFDLFPIVGPDLRAISDESPDFSFEVIDKALEGRLEPIALLLLPPEELWRY